MISKVEKNLSHNCLPSSASLGVLRLGKKDGESSRGSQTLVEGHEDSRQADKQR